MGGLHRWEVIEKKFSCHTYFQVKKEKPKGSWKS